jgi:hypothetical protein
MKTLVYSSTSRRFSLADNADIATAMLVMGNVDGFNRASSRIPVGATASLQTVRGVSSLTLKAPNGETLIATGGRIEMKRLGFELRNMGARFLNIPKSGKPVEILA